jgi:hypothetical protein
MQNMGMRRLPASNLRRLSLPRAPSLSGALVLFAVAGLVLALSQAQAASGKSTDPNRGGTYKYVDDKGVVHYGDRVPPEYAKRERAVLNSQGVEMRRLSAERTAEQIEADAARATAERKQGDHDKFLLTTYTSVRDIETLRDRRLEQIADQRRSVQSYIGTLNERLDALQARAQIYRPYNVASAARRMPDQLAEDIVRTLNEVRRQQTSVDQRLTEERDLRGQFQSDIDRYVALRSGAVRAGSAAPLAGR